MPDTFIKIASVTVGAGGAGSIAFTSIPSTYTDLCINFSIRTDTSTSGNGQFLGVSFNSSTANFSRLWLFGTGSTTGSVAVSDQYMGYINPSNYTANTFGNGSMYIPNYAGSTFKSMSVDTVVENNGTDANMALVAGLRSNTAAITAISLIPLAGNIVQYSTATLYGIKNS